MATNATAKECGVCTEEFDEEAKCPRIFQCFHTVCTFCVDQLIKNNTKKCPFCRSNFRANSFNDITINHTTLELVKYIALQESSTKYGQNDRAPPRKKRIEDLKKDIQETSSYHLVNCQKAEKQIERTLKEIINLQEYIKQENIRIEKDVLPNNLNVISQNNYTVEELERTKNKLQNQMKELEGKPKELEDVKASLDSCTANTFSETAALLDEAEETNMAIGCWIETFREIISEEKNTLRTTEKAIKRTEEKSTVNIEVLSSGEERDEEEFDIIARIAAMGHQEESLPIQLTPETLRQMRPQVKELVEQGRLYALQHHNGRRRNGRISFTENEKLCLHHLSEEPLPLNVHFVDYEAVMRLVDRSSRLTFLELGVGESTLGRLYIRLSPNTKRAKQFFYLCSGELGPSYANTNILEVWNNGQGIEWVRGGDYERNSGERGKALVPGVEDEYGGAYKRPWLAGSVVGLWEYARAAQFTINTIENPRVDLNVSFGIVEEGLSVLTEAIAHYPNIKEVAIRDCGIVLDH